MDPLKQRENLETTLRRVGILDRISGRVLDFFRIAVQEAFEMTHLPELLDVLGQEKFIALLNVFEGTDFAPCPHCGKPVRWPLIEEFLDVLRDVDIYSRVTGAAYGSKARVVRDLAREYNMTIGQIQSASKRMEARMRRYYLK